MEHTPVGRASVAICLRRSASSTEASALSRGNCHVRTGRYPRRHSSEPRQGTTERACIGTARAPRCDSQSMSRRRRVRCAAQHRCIAVRRTVQRPHPRGARLFRAHDSGVATREKRAPTGAATSLQHRRLHQRHRRYRQISSPAKASASPSSNDSASCSTPDLNWRRRPDRALRFASSCRR